MLIALATAAPAAAEDTHSGSFVAGTLNIPLGCAAEEMCTVTGMLGYDSVSYAVIDLEATDAQRPFALTATDHTGLADVDVCFRDAAGETLECFLNVGDEFGQVPVGSVTAHIYAWTGVGIEYEFALYDVTIQ